MARPKKNAAPATGAGTLTVVKADAIFDGKGGFLNPGATFDPVDDDAGKTLIERGLAR